MVTSQHIVLFPGTVEECFEFGWRASDYTERFQTPVFGMSDLDLGMNRWACSGLEYPTEEMDRGKVVREREAFEAFEEFGRYPRRRWRWNTLQNPPRFGNGTNTLPRYRAQPYGRLFRKAS